MSRKPYIKIVYPDASEIAMLLTEAMVRRASGKRVVETESAERESAGQDLFAGTLCCVTETSVELTLNLAPEAMDYALATLIAKNLTQPERDKAMAASDSLELDTLLARAQAAAGQDASCTEEVGTLRELTEDAEQSEEAEEKIEIGKLSEKEVRKILFNMIEEARSGKGSSFVLGEGIAKLKSAATQSGEQEKMVEIGKFSERALRDILNEMIDTMEKGHGTFDAVNHAVYEIKELAKASRRKLDPNGEKPIEKDSGLVDRLAVLICGAQRVTQKYTTPLKLYASDIDRYIKESFDDEAEYVVTARELARVLSDVQGNFAEDPKLTLEKALEIRAKARIDFEALKKDLDAPDQKETTWDDMEAEARQMQASALKQSAAPRADGDETDTEQDGEIEPGLLNDIDEDKSSTAEVGTLREPTEEERHD